MKGIRREEVVMGTTIKRVIFTTILLCSLLIFVLPSINIASAQGNPVESAQAAEDAKKAEAEAKEKAEAEANAEAEVKANTENQGDVAEPPSGPNVNIDTVIEEVDIQTPASVTGQKLDGTGTVTDFSTSGSKAFYTITDNEQNVFYLIIDLDKTDNNVYFLSDINKTDLEGTEIPEETVQTVPAEVQSAAAEAPEDSGSGFLIIVLLLAAVGVAAYYFLVMKKKQGKNNEDDEEDEMSEGYGEDDVYEDEKVSQDLK